MGGWGGVLAAAAGVVVLAAVLLDILVTSLHPSIESPLSGRFYRILWRVVGTLARHLPARLRRRLLGWMLPASIAGLLITWLVLLLCGFALLYMPGMGTSGAFHSAEPLGWADALYFSGSCLTSIGFGDICIRN